MGYTVILLTRKIKWVADSGTVLAYFMKETDVQNVADRIVLAKQSKLIEWSFNCRVSRYLIWLWSIWIFDKVGMLITTRYHSLGLLHTHLYNSPWRSESSIYPPVLLYYWFDYRGPNGQRFFVMLYGLPGSAPSPTPICSYRSVPGPFPG